jgi:hypothetical protein
MQLSDLIQAGNGLGDTFKSVFFKMLPRGAQIEKVRSEVNSGLLKKYGKLANLEIDNKKKVITADLDLKGENETVRIVLANYRLVETEGKKTVIELGTIEVSRAWMNALVKTLVKSNAIPERMEVSNPLHQIVVKSLL